jgi:cytochrome P450
MESLRLCHPLMSSSKLTKETTTLRVGERTYTIPVNSNVQVSFCGLGTNANIWGTDATAWNPARFIQSGTETDANNVFDSEHLRSSADKTFMPWSYGERVCPGKKFSQVELAATLAILFQNHRVHPVPENGESLGGARRRAQNVSLDVQMTLLCEMFKPERVGLRWTSRE